jgi:hypothetical protein
MNAWESAESRRKLQQNVQQNEGCVGTNAFGCTPVPITVRHLDNERKLKKEKARAKSVKYRKVLQTDHVCRVLFPV